MNTPSEIILPHYCGVETRKNKKTKKEQKKDKKDMVGRDNEQTQNLGVTQSFKSSPEFSPLTTAFTE